jgi:predicted dehydrogenase
LLHAEYVQDWLSTPLEATGQKQAAWRVDPAQAGAGGSLGRHRHARRTPGALYQRPAAASRSAPMCRLLWTGRQLDDNAHVLMRYANGARGMLWSSQVAPGNENGLKVRVYGTKAGLEFRQEHPNQLWFTPLGGAPQLDHPRRRRSGTRTAAHASRIPAGHPEGYLEAFAQLYTDFAEQLHARWEQRAPNPLACHVPTVEDGLRGMQFIEAVVASSRAGGRWTAVA